MVAIAEARQKAEDVIKETGLHLSDVWDDGQFFFGYKEEAGLPGVGVDKFKGELDVCFPPAHKAFLEAVRIKE